LLRLRSVKYETYKGEKERWEKRTREQKKHLRFKKDPDKYLAELEEWLIALNVPFKKKTVLTT